MTRPRRNSGVPLPHTSLLTFFPNCSPPIPPITCADLPSPPPYTPSAPPPTPRPYHVLPVINEDEEWNHGFWGEKTAYGEKSIEICQVGQDDDDEEEYDLYDEFCFYAGVIVCVLACFGVVFVLGLMGKYWNLSIGSPAWMGRWEDESKVEMKFCLASQNHQAPGPQTWKYIRAGGEKACTTDTITLEVAADEVWKMMVDDEIDIEKNKPQTTISGEKGKFVQFKAYRRIGDRESIGR